jgi:hypothetical protein
MNEILWDRPCKTYSPMSMCEFCSVCGFSKRKHIEEWGEDAA